MRVPVFSTRPFDRDFLTRAARSFDHELTFLEPRLTIETAALASAFRPCVSS